MYNLVGTHWIGLYVSGDNITYFDAFGDQKKNKKFIDTKNITANVYRKQKVGSIMCGYFCI